MYIIPSSSVHSKEANEKKVEKIKIIMFEASAYTSVVQKKSKELSSEKNTRTYSQIHNNRIIQDKKKKKSRMKGKE